MVLASIVAGQGPASLAAAAPLSQVPATPGGERIARAWAALEQVLDPEVPALSVVDLGLVRELAEAGDGALEVTLTPTYSGCPATELIEQQVLAALQAAGLGPARALTRRSPAWSTDWISAAGRRKLREYGIAPPGPACHDDGAVPIRLHRRATAFDSAIECPRCGSAHTERLSAFGSTACKAQYRCLACLEPFDYFKPY